MSQISKSNTPNMIYTPNYHIPIGQAVKTPEGIYGIRVKKDKDTYETITLDTLMSQIVHITDKAI